MTANDIAEVLSRRTGIPVAQLTEDEKPRLLKLEEALHDRVVGQDEAVTAVAEAVRRYRAGMGDPDRPDRIVPLPRAHRRGQDRTGQGARRSCCSATRTG